MAGLPPFDAAGEAEHGSLHGQAPGHHHHDDGSIHQDDSSESAQHFHADHGLSSAFLLTGESASLPLQRPPVPMRSTEPVAPQRFIDVPLRPPRSTA